MTFTVKNHGVIVGINSKFSGKYQMIATSRVIKKVPNSYEVIDTTSDLSKYTKSHLKSFKNRSGKRMFEIDIVKEVRAGNVVRVGSYVITYDKKHNLFEIWHKVKVV
jgi:hypothetical protein